MAARKGALALRSVVIAGFRLGRWRVGMFTERKRHLSEIKRVRIAEGRDLEHGLRLDRNEKVDVWPSGMLVDVFTAQPDYFLSVYPELTSLYQKLADFHGVDTNNLLLTSGIDGGLKTIFEVVSEPGDLVGVVTPTYAMYAVYARIFESNLTEISYTSDLKFDFDQFDDFLEREPKIFFLPNPNQPIESSFTTAELESFAQRTLERGCLFVIDEAYHLFGAESGIELIQRYENVVVARTFSKAFGVPSIRLGYLISNAANIDALSKTRFAHESNSLSNAVAEYLLGLYAMVEAYHAQVVAAREELKEALGNLDIPTRGWSGNFLLLDLGSEDRARAFVDELREQTVYVKGPWSAPWGNYVTITVGPMKIMHRFLTATKAFVTKQSEVAS